MLIKFATSHIPTTDTVVPMIELCQHSFRVKLIHILNKKREVSYNMHGHFNLFDFWQTRSENLSLQHFFNWTHIYSRLFHRNFKLNV